MAGSTVDRVQQTLADVFGVDVTTITDESSPDTLEQWDSMGHMNLVLALEQRFRVSFTPEEFAELNSVKTITQWVEAKLGDATDLS
ncbi:MAG: acyl carrier protein [Phycisphaeraceae bacterium]